MASPIEPRSRTSESGGTRRTVGYSEVLPTPEVDVIWFLRLVSKATQPHPWKPVEYWKYLTQANWHGIVDMLLAR